MGEHKHLNIVMCKNMNEGEHYGEQTPFCEDCGCHGEDLLKYPTCEQYRIETRQEEAMRFMYPEFCKE